MKKNERSMTKLNDKKSVKNINDWNYLNLSNQQYLVRTLRLLGVTEQQFLKQTKTSLTAQLFPKTVINPTVSKHFFFIMIVCLKQLLNNDELPQIQMWYPPRNVNEQLQFKKAAFKSIQKLQAQGKAPKDILVTKGVLMGDTTAGSLVQFLRFLSQLALRELYIQKHSKRSGLVQVAINDLPISKEATQNDINRFYRYPFVPSKTNSEVPKVNLLSIKNIYRKHLQNYKQKICKIRTSSDQTLLDAQQIMAKLLEQKQLAQTLNKNIPKEMLSENRAFDRRRTMDRSKQIWKEIKSVQCQFTQTNSIPVIRIEGQIDQILTKWSVGLTMSKVHESNSQMKNIENLKRQAKKMLANFQDFKRKLSQKIMCENKLQDALRQIQLSSNAQKK